MWLQKKETTLDLAGVLDGLPELATKTKLLNAANLIKYSLGGPPKTSKFALEVAYLIKVISMTLKEVKTKCKVDFSNLLHQPLRTIRCPARARSGGLPEIVAHLSMPLLHKSIEIAMISCSNS
jgi:hypothetical protein